MKNLILLFILFSLLLTSCSNKPKAESQLSTCSIQTSIKDNKYKTKSNEDTIKNNDISNKTKEYILNGQDDKPEADKLKWSKTFLNKVNIDKIYEEYLTNGGYEDNIESFAEYLTLNAPILDNWKDLAAIDLLNTYNEKISRIEHLEDDLYQIYVKLDDNTEVVYVTVNARTGYFHG